MKRLLIGLLLFFLSDPIGAAPRVWGKSGTATTSNATVTVGGSSPFNPSFVCVFNDGGSNDLYFNFTGTASTTDNVGNFIMKPSTGRCYNFNYDNVTNTFTIGLITSSSTTTYRIEAGQR